MYNHWTTKQEQFLAEHSGEGVSEIATAMYNEFGVRRSEQAIKNKAFKLGLSLTRFQICAMCGAQVKTIQPQTGYCALCTAKANRDKAKSQARQLQANERVIKDELPKARREYAKYRQQKHRANRM